MAKCPKILEIFWLIDKKLPQGQVPVIERHIQQCKTCKSKFDRAQTYFKGLSGVIVQGSDDSSCPSPVTIVKSIQMRNTPEDDAQLNAHLEHCKHCLKKYADYYTNRLSQEEVMRKEKVEADKERAQEREAAGSYRGVYADKMDKIDWWLGGEFHFLGLRFSKLYVAVVGALFVFVCLWGFVFLNYILTPESVEKEPTSKMKQAKKNQTEQSTSPSTKGDSQQLDLEREMERKKLRLYLLSGKLYRSSEQKPLAKGLFATLPSHRLYVPKEKSALMGFQGADLAVAGPAQFQLTKHKLEKGVLYVKAKLKRGIFLLNIYYPLIQIRFLFSQNQVDYSITPETPKVKCLLILSNRRAKLYALNGNLNLDAKSPTPDKSAYLTLKQNRFLEIHNGKVEKSQFYKKLPLKVAQLFPQKNPLFQLPIGKSAAKLFQSEKKTSAVFTTEQGPTGIYTKITSQNTLETVRIRTPATSTKLDSFYLFTLSYQFYGNEKSGVLEIWQTYPNGQKHLKKSYPLYTESQWKNYEEIFYFPASTKEIGSRFYLVIRFPGIAQLNLQKLELAQLEFSRKPLAIFPSTQASPLSDFSPLTGQFHASSSALIGKSTKTPGILLSQKTHSSNLYLQAKALWPTPLAFVLNWQQSSNAKKTLQKNNLSYTLVEIYPQERKIVCSLIQKGVLWRKIKENIPFPIQPPIYVEIRQQKQLLLIRINQKDILALPSPPSLLPKGGKSGWWILPDTKQKLRFLQILVDG
ncbi:MAG: hypothetical protein D6805_03875 [Planctomycetota bacterium]|nr:MAG: hypothetical protein D6805_03875 [Planctomycetota bacterium]